MAIYNPATIKTLLQAYPAERESLLEALERVHKAHRRYRQSLPCDLDTPTSNIKATTTGSLQSVEGQNVADHASRAAGITEQGQLSFHYKQQLLLSNTTASGPSNKRSRSRKNRKINKTDDSKSASRDTDQEEEEEESDEESDNAEQSLYFKSNKKRKRDSFINTQLG